ncbi:quinol dehydrogenase ferredoxin subunit NapH [Accumulibacter sp.]|uniref:quinol dehydrogenase ferredoxin subunit NapH n=1 Tax=Accumulibacter sp. TaxID=2053492 RepID=UPI001AC83EC9|nr:quinol dehydrogenase ferredoxin subunit NapH [Accumulibacter sp.]MBN8514930.1 quinol dehydrogenase ferredoxin subunit NapH [Accumulibacter sp.]MBO3703855.1 quinol dehydrogenase ferredoxin subunit NapH [Accumulibacter sp.]
MNSKRAGAEAVASKGWVAAHRWLLARRLCQLAILALFLLGPLAAVWIVKGNLAYSLTLDSLPLTDPYVLLQSLLAGNWPEKLALIGALIVIVFYFLVGGRVYCAWVCPINPLTDLAGWLRRRLGIKGSAHVSRSSRYWILAMTLLLASLTGSIAWELVNPVSMLHRGLLFGLGATWVVVLAVFLFDLFVMSRGWCGHLCPVGAFYSLLGKGSPLRVAASRRAACNDCMDCFEVCPEPQVIRPALKGAGKGIGPVILASNCTNCGRCIDVCSKDVFTFGLRFNNPPDNGTQGEATAATSGH